MCFITPLPLLLEWYSKRENSIAFIHKFPITIAGLCNIDVNAKQTALLQWFYHLQFLILYLCEHVMLTYIYTVIEVFTWPSRWPRSWPINSIVNQTRHVSSSLHMDFPYTYNWFGVILLSVRKGWLPQPSAKTQMFIYSM